MSMVNWVLEMGAEGDNEKELKWKEKDVKHRETMDDLHVKGSRRQLDVQPYSREDRDARDAKRSKEYEFESHYREDRDNWGRGLASVRWTSSGCRNSDEESSGWISQIGGIFSFGGTMYGEFLWLRAVLLDPLKCASCLMVQTAEFGV